MISLLKCEEIIRPMLSDSRFYHSKCVAKEAKRLAIKYGADIEKAEIAGMLHDVCKEMPANEQLKIISNFDIIMSETEKNTPKLYHAISGAAYVKYVIGINNDEIVDAVRWHTSGREDMTLLEKVIFTADFTSDDRDYPDVNEMRRLAEISLDDAMLYGFSYTIKMLAEKQSLIDVNTAKAYNQILCNKKREKVQ